jgi:hypothetical protein
MEKFFNEKIVPNLTSLSKFYLALHFYESVIFSLIKRRETTIKKNVNLVKEIEMENNYKETSVLNEEAQVIKEDDNTLITNNKTTVKDNQQQEENEKLDDNEKTVSYEPDNMDVDKTESFPPSANNSDKKQKPHKEKLSKNANEKVEEIKTKTRGRRANVPKDLKAKEWQENCYICGEYGDLICCEKCTNVAHLFCACLEV